MPLKIDPSETTLVCLPAYDGEPEATRPAFVMVFPTTRKLREAWRLEAEADKAYDANDLVGWTDNLRAAVLIGLKGIQNVPGNPKPEDVDDLLKPAEMRELLGRWYAATRLTSAEKKQLPSLPSAAPGASATGAATGGEAASASQP